MKEIAYTIVKAPVRVEYTCPYCGWEHEVDWDDFLSNCCDEYEAWTANSNDIFECEECEGYFSFNEVDID